MHPYIRSTGPLASEETHQRSINRAQGQSDAGWNPRPDEGHILFRFSKKDQPRDYLAGRVVVFGFVFPGREEKHAAYLKPLGSIGTSFAFWHGYAPFLSFVAGDKIRSIAQVNYIVARDTSCESTIGCERPTTLSLFLVSFCCGPTSCLLVALLDRARGLFFASLSLTRAERQATNPSADEEEGRKEGRGRREGAPAIIRPFACGPYAERFVRAIGGVALSRTHNSEDCINHGKKPNRCGGGVGGLRKDSCLFLLSKATDPEVFTPPPRHRRSRQNLRVGVFREKGAGMDPFVNRRRPPNQSGFWHG